MPMSKQDYKFFGVLYPDAENYDCQAVLDSLTVVFADWAYISHDMDTTPEGELKKAHIHWVGIRRTDDGKESPCSVDTVAGALGVPARDIEYCKSVKSAVRYLIHADDADKFQYSISAIQCNFSLDKYFRDRSMSNDARRILEYIMGNHPRTVMELSGWCLDNNCWSEFRRGFAIWSSILREVDNLG